ncbi:MAG: PHB depolymerase family esterase [Acidobacteriota bacterium]
MNARRVRRRAKVLGAVFSLLGLPPLLALLHAVDFHLKNRNNGSLVSSGEEREYLLFVPDSYDPSEPTPLVINLHGGALWPALHRDLSGWNELAERKSFLTVYPAGLGKRWRVLREGPGVAQDVQFIDDLIDTLAASYNVDTRRIFVNGLSNGGGMAFVLSCELADRIGAVGLVASAQMLPWSRCEGAPPMPMISIHGTADELAPYDGGSTWVAPPGVEFPSVAEWTELWARRNRCRPSPEDSSVTDSIVRRDYRGCERSAAVVLFTIYGGGHTWPGGLPMAEWFLGPTTSDIDAKTEMWNFFEEHPLRHSAPSRAEDTRSRGRR